MLWLLFFKQIENKLETFYDLRPVLGNTSCNLITFFDVTSNALFTIYYSFLCIMQSNACLHVLLICLNIFLNY